MQNDFEFMNEIGKGIKYLKETTNNLPENNYERLSAELKQIHDNISSLGELVDHYMEIKKESKAKEQISDMLENGYSFSRIDMEDMFFSISDSGEINRCFGRFEEPDDYPAGLAPPEPWPH
jgi:formyltetrahydrofolate synthetase